MMTKPTMTTTTTANKKRREDDDHDDLEESNGKNHPYHYSIKRIRQRQVESKQQQQEEQQPEEEVDQRRRSVLNDDRSSGGGGGGERNDESSYQQLLLSMDGSPHKGDGSNSSSLCYTRWKERPPASSSSMLPSSSSSTTTSAIIPTSSSRIMAASVSFPGFQSPPPLQPHDDDTTAASPPSTTAAAATTTTTTTTSLRSLRDDQRMMDSDEDTVANCTAKSEVPPFSSKRRRKQQKKNGGYYSGINSIMMILQQQQQPHQKQKQNHHHPASAAASTAPPLYRLLLIGGLVGAFSAICVLFSLQRWNPAAVERLTTAFMVDRSLLLSSTLSSSSSSFHNSHQRRGGEGGGGLEDQIRGRNYGHHINTNKGIRSYLDLFQHRRHRSKQHHKQEEERTLEINIDAEDERESTEPTSRPAAVGASRRLDGTMESPSSSSSSSPSFDSSYGSSSSKSSSSSPLPHTGSSSAGNSNGGGGGVGGSGSTSKNEDYKDAQLVIAGKMAVEDAPCNIAQLNLKLNKWSLDERIQLSLYNSYSGGEVYMLLANHTTEMTKAEVEPKEESLKNRLTPPLVPFEGSGELIVVGAFDTTYRNSQVTYCSVGMWDGQMLSKVGEGLCNSALSKGMKITTAALAGPQDVYVAGSFQTQVWNGDRHEFVKIFNIAHYNAVNQVWLPLNIGQITCSWCTVTVLALAWDSKRRQLHVAGKFNAIDGRNVPAGLAVYDMDSGHLVAHPGGGLSMWNATQDGVGTALQLDEESGVLYVMGSFERLTATRELCYGLAAYEINTNRWTCLADSAHTVQPTGGGNMLLTPFGLMVAGKVSGKTTWVDDDRPYTIALLKATLKTHEVKQPASGGNDDDLYFKDDDSASKEKKTKSKSSTSSGSKSGSTNSVSSGNSSSYMTKKETYHEFDWSWLPGFDGHDEPLHALSNGFGDHTGTVFIAGDNLVAKWSYRQRTSSDKDPSHRQLYQSDSTSTSSQPRWVAVTENLSGESVRGAIMAISQMMPEPESPRGSAASNNVNITIIIYCVAAGCLIGMFGAIMWNRNFSSIFPCFDHTDELKGISLDTLTYSALENSNITDAYQRAMKTRYVQHPHLLTIIDPQEIFLQRIIGEGTFGRVWSAKWRSASVAVKEFVFAQAAVAGKSSMQQEIVEEIIGEAGMMAILRHPNVLQLFGCSLTAQAIWIVSELCSLGSLRQVLDDNDRSLPVQIRISLALQVAEGMTYLHNQVPEIIHRDLKSHNIFVHETFTETDEVEELKKSKKTISRDDNQQNVPWWKPQKMTTHSTLVAKIGDWGSARATLSGSRTMTHGVGTACWLAPEVIKHARSSKYSDVYGYGIILWELATREEVYQGLETTQIIAKVANESLRPPIPQDCPWKDVMVQCWSENPHARPEFSEIAAELNEGRKKMEKQIASNTSVEVEHGKERRVKSNKSADANDEEVCTEDETREGSPLLSGERTPSPPPSEQSPPKKRKGGFGMFSNVLRNARGE